MFQIHMINSGGVQIAEVKDMYSAGLPLTVENTNKEDPSGLVNNQNVILCAGGRNSNVWDVTVVREVITGDLHDSDIDDLSRSLIYAKSDSDTFTVKHTSIIVKQSQRFARYQICHSLCSSCSGPEEYDCMSCIPNYALFGSAPAPCYQIYTANCDPVCLSCKLFTTISLCLAC